MSIAWTGEIRMFAGNYAPEGWMFCQGQLLSIAEFKDLYSLLGFRFGGDVKTGFRLPDLSARIPVGRSNTAPPGMSKTYELGKAGGTYFAKLEEASMPAHTHTWHASKLPATTTTPSPDVTFATAAAGTTLYAHSTSSALLPLAEELHAPAGAGAPHENVMPSMPVQFIIYVQKSSFPTFE